MGNLATIQDRLATAFGGAAAKPEEPGVAEAPAFAPPSVSPSSELPSSRLMLRHWLGGGGITFIVFLVLIMALSGSVSGAWIAASAGAAACLLLWRPLSSSMATRRQVDRSAEAHQDMLWEQSERATVLSTIHDTLGDIVITRTMERRIVHANLIFRQLTRRHDPIGLTCEEIGLAFRPNAEAHHYDVEIAAPEGQRIFTWHDVIVRDAATGRLMLQSIARDVTLERRAAQAREEARQKAEDTSAAKSRLLATVSHEIRTPLSGILGMSHLLGQTRLTREQANYLAGMRQSANGLVQLVEDLLDFSTIEVGRFQLHPRSESLRRLLESVVEMLAHRAHEKNIEIGATVDPQVPELMNFDTGRLRQVLFNVIGNAVKFTHVGGVFIRARIEDGDLIIAVKDSGPGMTPEESGQIFGEFEQSGSSTQKSAGTGLGLSISARIMQEFGGTLTVESEKGVGSEFTIRFPVGIIPREGRASRNSLLKDSRVLVLAPAGVAADALVETVTALGGLCRVATSGDAAISVLTEMMEEGATPTDIIVDHRLSAHYSRHLANRPDVKTPRLRKIFLVNPEERGAHGMELFDAWLIRPLREQSLIDVLRGRMRGMEKRDALNDNQPGFGSSSPEPAALPGTNIVLAEDDPVNAMLVRAMLEKAGHVVRVVEDFGALLDLVTGDHRPDIVVSDLSMPGGDGIDMLGRIRAHERRLDLPPLPILVLTADDREETRRHAIVNGANRILSKPVDPQKLLAVVASLAALTPRRTGEG